MMSILDLARKVYNRQKARRNGHCHPPTLAPLVARVAAIPLPESNRAYEENEVNEESPPPYQLVRDAAGLQTVGQALDETAVVGLDIETTGLSPHADQIRLLTLRTDRGTYLIDCFRIDPRPLWDILSDPEHTIIGANLTFDLPFLWHHYGFEHQGRLLDVVLLSRLLTAGGPNWRKNALDDLADRLLGITLDKTFQHGDYWKGDLTEKHYHYAAADVDILPDVYKRLEEQLHTAGLTRVAEIEMEALPAWIWLCRSGVLIDQDAWRKQAEVAEERLSEAAAEVEQLAPPRQDCLPGVDNWNFRSKEHVQEALALLRFTVKDTKGETLAAIDHPFAQAVRHFRQLDHYVSRYGKEALDQLAPDGRIYASWNQLGNEAGRTSCKEPNLQGINKDGELRRCFVAAPGHCVVKADFSQAHLRIVAKMAGETVLENAYRRGDDLHQMMARKITGKTNITKEERQLAKACNFGLLYGMSAKRLLGYAKSEYGIEMTLEQARQARQSFFSLYPAIARWHRETERRNAKETRSLCDRRRLCHEKMWLGDRLSSPVLGTEADALKIALGLLWRRRKRYPDCRLVLAVHDEVVLEVPEAQADAAKSWLTEAMTEAMRMLIESVPVAVDASVSRTWKGD
jgi:DNA polymerase-1